MSCDMLGDIYWNSVSPVSCTGHLLSRNIVADPKRIQRFSMRDNSLIASFELRRFVSKDHGLCIR